jgi:hypothetical protein
MRKICSNNRVHLCPRVRRRRVWQAIGRVDAAHAGGNDGCTPQLLDLIVEQLETRDGCYDSPTITTPAPFAEKEVREVQDRELKIEGSEVQDRIEWSHLAQRMQIDLAADISPLRLGVRS